MSEDRGWWNYKTWAWDNRPPETDEIARQYLMQNHATQLYYRIRRTLGDTILDAMLKALYAQLGEKPPESEQKGRPE